MPTPEYVLIYAACGNGKPWCIIEAETGEVIDYFETEEEAHQTLEDWS